MSTSVFIHIQTDGSIYVSSDYADNAPGTLLGTFRVSGEPCLTKIGQLTGNSGAYSLSGTNGKTGIELGLRK